MRQTRRRSPQGKSHQQERNNPQFGYAEFRSRSHRAVIRVYDAARKSDRNARARGRFQKSRSAERNKKPQRSEARGLIVTCSWLFMPLAFFPVFPK